ncbi:NAD(P)-dependent dehydrogenase (short-subunit alcohol dehydrogenase family) [Marinobacterium sp. MBR-111]|jgi:NAD(P)-dependent dehydrogenase (short-subunit alcohol dehydrogenase family)|uniref:SDR family NAD(P)-dependent oxidoreductase n=1 Tax=Marinobacterium sp. MBR-111 TaxID=3156463 RepID=UPI003394CCF8
MKEQIVLVGATGAFGKVIVKSLTKAGYQVVAVARTAESLQALQQIYPELLTCQADISNDAAIDVIRQVATGPVRAVVHGPGVGVAGGILEAPTDTLNQAVNIKVAGLLRLVRAIDKQLSAHSRLIAIGGHYGFEPTAYAAAAGVANAALVNVVRQLSLAYGDRGITAHLIAPGPADTERLHRVAASRAERQGSTLDEVMEEMRHESSIGAFTTPEQVAWAVRMLLEPEADAMTGSTLMLDSGRRRGIP